MFSHPLCLVFMAVFAILPLSSCQTASFNQKSSIAKQSGESSLIAACQRTLMLTKGRSLKGFERAVGVVFEVPADDAAPAVEIIAWSDERGAAARYICDGSSIHQTFQVQDVETPELELLEGRLSLAAGKRGSGRWSAIRLLGNHDGMSHIPVLVARPAADAKVRKVLTALEQLFATMATATTDLDPDSVTVVIRRPALDAH